MNKPTVILATVKNIIYIYYIVFDLIEHQIPLFYIHLMIFIRWNIRFFEERKFMWHIFQRTYCFYQLFLFLMAASLLTCAIKRMCIPSICFALSETITLYLVSVICYTSAITESKYASRSSRVQPFLPAILSSSTERSSSLNFIIFSKRL